jgi:hypothetical protein
MLQRCEALKPDGMKFPHDILEQMAARGASHFFHEMRSGADLPAMLAELNGQAVAEKDPDFDAWEAFVGGLDLAKMLPERRLQRASATRSTLSPTGSHRSGVARGSRHDFVRQSRRRS